MQATNLCYAEFKTLISENIGFLPRVRSEAATKGLNLYVLIPPNNYHTYVHVNTEEYADYEANIKPHSNTGLTVEGWQKSALPPAGPQPIEYANASFAFEIPTDAMVAAQTLPRNCVSMEGTGPASDSNPIKSIHRYSIKTELALNGIGAAWQDIPRFTEVVVDTGFYLNPADPTTFQRLGGFTLNYSGFRESITLSGTSDTPIPYPITGAWASAAVYPTAVIPGIGEVQLYLHMEIVRTRPCFRDADNNEIPGYIDLDFDFTRKKATGEL